jgi:DNA-binding NtrC family response regulator
LKTLVVIDDEQEMEFLYSLMLEKSIESGSLDLKFFSDARDFSKWLEDNTPDLVLCDINMPYLSGIEIGRLIKQTDKNIPIYFISGYEASDYQDIMNELGVSHFLSKPPDYDQLLTSINSELGLPPSNI